MSKRYNEVKVGEYVTLRFHWTNRAGAIQTVSAGAIVIRGSAGDVLAETAATVTADGQLEYGWLVPAAALPSGDSATLTVEWRGVPTVAALEPYKSPDIEITVRRTLTS